MRNVFTLITFLTLLSNTLINAQPFNDLCINAPVVACGDYTSGTTVGANIDNFTCVTSTTTGGVWYRFIGNNSAVTLNTCTNLVYDTKISVFSGSCGNLVCENGNDDAVCGLGSSLTFNAYQGRTYYIMVHGYNTQTGTFTLFTSCTPIPPFPACNPVSNIQTTPSLTESIIGWICTGCSGTYTVEYGPDGFTPGTGIVITNASNPITVTNLTPSTVYDFTITQACVGTSSTVSNGTFTTTGCDPVTSVQVDPSQTEGLVSWSCNSCPGTYTLEYGPAGFTPGAGTTVPNVTSPYNITGLSVSSEYDFYITQICGIYSSTTTNGSFITDDLTPNLTDLCNAIEFDRLLTSRFPLGSSTINCVSLAGNNSAANLASFSSCGLGTARTVWYQFTTPDCFVGGNLSAFDVKFSTDNPGTNYNTRLTLYQSSDNTCNGTFTSVYCNDDKATAGCVGSPSATTSTIHATPGGQLEAGRTYWVAVSGFDIASVGDFELTISVEPAAPTLTNNSSNPTGVIDATWPAVNPDSYRLYWRPTGGTGYAIRTLNTNSFSTNAGAMLMPNTSYDYWVNNWCGATAQTSFSSPIATLATAAPSAGCSVPLPTCAASTPTTISLNWPEITGAVRIGARYSFTGQAGYNQSSMLAYTTSGGVSSFNFVGLQSNMTYTFTFFVECDGRIFWSSPVSCSTGTAQSRLAPDVHSFEYDGTEFVDVRMTDFEFFSPAAGLPDHVVDVSSGQLEVTFIGNTSMTQAPINFTLNPNVTTDHTIMTVYTEKLADAKLFITDLNGQLVQSMALGEITNGQQINIYTNELAAGVYLLHLQSNTSQKTQKLVIVR